jgi:hypothetical protein
MCPNSAEVLALSKPCLEEISLTSILLFHQLVRKFYIYIYMCVCVCVCVCKKSMSATLGYFILISNNSTMNNSRGQYILLVIHVPIKLVSVCY